jgi:RNA polymerase sigma factor (sigma-70 family)
MIEHLRRAILRQEGAQTDGELLGAFLSRRDETAFEALVRRHGPMVLGVCRRVLQNAQDAEDAFQATFLVLVRKGAGVRPREMVGNWLYGVAYRTALQARGVIARRRTKEKQVSDMPQPSVEPEPNETWKELKPLLDEELSRLPDKYRLPLVLCDLEGRTRRAVARQLGLPDSTLSNRLSTARKMLAQRLSRRGLTISSTALTATLGESAASAAVPAALIVSTTQAAALVAAGGAATAVSANVTILMEGVLKAMLGTKLKIVTVVLLLVGLAGAGAGLLTHSASATQENGLVGDGPKPGKGGKPTPKVPPSAQADKTMESKLSARIEVKYKDADLQEVLHDLQSKTGLNLIVDEKTLEKDKVPAPPGVTLRLKGVTVQTVLRRILNEVGMGYILEDDILTVTSERAARETLVRRVYPVADLVSSKKEPRGIPPGLKGPPGGPRMPGSPVEMIEETEGDTLVRIIRRTVEPGTWSPDEGADAAGGGAIEYFPEGKSLVVIQHTAAQYQIQTLLDELRAAKKLQEKK